MIGGGDILIFDSIYNFKGRFFVVKISVYSNCHLKINKRNEMRDAYKFLYSFLFTNNNRLGFTFSHDSRDQTDLLYVKIHEILGRMTFNF